MRFTKYVICLLLPFLTGTAYAATPADDPLQVVRNCITEHVKNVPHGSAYAGGMVIYACYLFYRLESVGVENEKFYARCLLTASTAETEGEVRRRAQICLERNGTPRGLKPYGKQ